MLGLHLGCEGKETEGSADPEKHASFESGDIKQETRTCQLRGRDPDQPQKDSERVNGQLPPRTEKSFPLFSSSSLPLLY